MNRYYFEFIDRDTGQHHYACRDSERLSDILHNATSSRRFPLRAMYTAQRVWEESARGVCFIKHRWALGPLSDIQIDEKEFMWVKLSAVELPDKYR